MTLTHFQLRRRLLEHFPRAQILLFDSSYQTLPKRSVSKQFARDVSDYLDSRGLSNWKTYWDCNRFALTAWHLAQVKHALASQQGQSETQAPSFGVIAYPVDGQSFRQHMINWLLTEEGEVLTWEPQTQSWRTINEEEATKAWLVQS